MSPPATAPHGTLDRLYEILVEDEDARACRDIPDRECTNLPRNFFLLVAGQLATKIGDELSNAKTVLAWLLGAVGAPVFFVSLLVPIRESGALVPQLLFAAPVRARPLRKSMYGLGNLLQGLLMIAIALAGLTLSGLAAGIAIIGALTAFSLARGLASVAAKDVIGKTIPKGRRGRLNGYSGSLAGVVAMAAGLAFLFLPMDDGGRLILCGVLLVAGILWLVAAVLLARVAETPGATGGGANAWREALGAATLLRTDVPFRRFVIVRALLLCSALTAPFLVVLAQGTASGDAGVQAGVGLLGGFIIANGLASALSAPVWGRWADRSSRRVLAIGGLMSAGLALAIAVIQWLAPALASMAWIYPVAFFILGIAHSGVRMGRKTYVLDLGGGERRTDYVAVSNSVIGVVLLAVGLATAILSLLSPVLVIVVLAVFGLAGALLTWSLPEVE